MCSVFMCLMLTSFRNSLWYICLINRNQWKWFWVYILYAKLGLIIVTALRRNSARRRTVLPINDVSQLGTTAGSKKLIWWITELLHYSEAIVYLGLKEDFIRLLWMMMSDYLELFSIFKDCYCLRNFNYSEHLLGICVRFYSLLI